MNSERRRPLSFPCFFPAPGVGRVGELPRRSVGRSAMALKCREGGREGGGPCVGGGKHSAPPPPGVGTIGEKETLQGWGRRGLVVHGGLEKRALYYSVQQRRTRLPLWIEGGGARMKPRPQLFPPFPGRSPHTALLTRFPGKKLF